MRVLITGAAGFLGARLLRALVNRGQLGGRPITNITLADLVEPVIPRTNEIEITPCLGDLADPAYIENLATQRFDTIFHLASLLTLQAETDPAKAYAVTVGSLRRLLDAAQGCPKVIFASSIAIHGGELPFEVGDDLDPQPATTYGSHKAINELVIADYSRLGRIDGRSLRLPIVLIRPGTPSPSVSDKVASIIREPLNGIEVVAPLAAHTYVPLVSAGAVIAAFLKLHDIPAENLPAKRAFNLPSLTVTIADMARVVARRGAKGRVSFDPDPQMQAIVEGWPQRFVSAAADRLGIASDKDLDEIIDDYLTHKDG